MELNLKFVGLICVTVVAVAILLTNKDDEEVVFKVICMVLIALCIIFTPLIELISLIINKLF